MVAPGCFDHVSLDSEVFEQEINRVSGVGVDSSDLCRRQHDVLGVLIGKEPVHCRLAFKVEFVMAATDEVGVTACPETAKQGRPHQAPMAGYVYS